MFEMKDNSKELGITFGVQNTSKSKQLVIVGPKEFMAGMHEDFKVSRGYPFKLLAPEKQDVATWKLNATAIGKMNNSHTKSVSESLLRANDFISRLVQSIANGEVPGDPMIDLATYEPSEQGFDFSAEIRKPMLNPRITEMIAEHNVTSIAEDFGMRGGLPKVQVFESTGQHVVSGLNMSIGKNSAVKTIDHYDDSFELQGRNIREGKQPLIYLMGAVTVAHADTLANQ